MINGRAMRPGAVESVYGLLHYTHTCREYLILVQRAVYDRHLFKANDRRVVTNLYRARIASSHSLELLLVNSASQHALPSRMC